MDINLLRTLVTVLSFAIFVGIVWWALSKSNRSRFEEAAMLPFADDDANDNAAQLNAARGTAQRKDETQSTREQG
jgi:cytochrome c oxidase cbb3-type subunit IV